MDDELMTIEDIAKLYRCTPRHARDVICKLMGFPPVAPGSTQRRPLRLTVEVRAYLYRREKQEAAA